MGGKKHETANANELKKDTALLQLTIAWLEWNYYLLPCTMLPVLFNS